MSAAPSAPLRLDLAGLGIAESLGLATRIATARLVCLPTDTVYGIGAALSPGAAPAIAAAKGRDVAKPLQVVFPTREVLLAAVSLGPVLRDACLRLLPGPVTLVLPYPEGFTVPAPGEVVHERKRLLGKPQRHAVPTLGVRVPRWPVRARLLETLSFPMLASSANRSGEPPARTLDDVDAGLLSACELALDGGPSSGLASTVVDLSVYEATREWRVLRHGEWDEAEIRERLTRRREDLPRV